MPTSAELPRSTHLSYQEGYSWTDDLPVCRQSGVGYSTNQIYREDGYRQEEHEFEDRSFHFCIDNSTFLYGVFDGHEGTQAATFAFQRMAAEILLGQLSGKTTDEEVKEVLRQAFIAVEKGYLDSIDDRLAERTSLQYEIPDGLTSYEAYQKYPALVDKLNSLNCELSAGTTAVVALVYGGRLYVANVGDSRALLCRTDSNGVLRVVQLSVDHDMKNEDEVLRLSQLGLNIERVQQETKIVCTAPRSVTMHEKRSGIEWAGGWHTLTSELLPGGLTLSCRLGNQENTRCVGNYIVKGGYKEFDELATATSEPIIAEPEIHGGILLDESCRFLLLMSDGLYKSLEEATGTDQVNKEIAQMAVEQFRVQSTLNGVAQTVVEKIGRIHHDVYMSGSAAQNDNCRVNGKRDDMTFLVRNFNFPMPNALSSPTGAVVRFNPVVTTVSSSSWSGGETSTTENSVPEAIVTNTTEEQNNDTSTTESSSDLFQEHANPVDRNKKIEPYVDFSEFYKNVEIARQEGTLPVDIDF